MAEDMGIAKYILDNPDNKDPKGKPPYWLFIGILFSLAAVFTGSIKFIFICFLAGSVIWVLFSYVKSRMFWRNLPYWLRGGVIGTTFVLLSIGLSSLCLYHFTSPGSWGFECLPFGLPTLPITFVLIPIANSLSSPALIFIILLVYFVIGVLIGRLIGYLKSRK